MHSCSVATHVIIEIHMLYFSRWVQLCKLFMRACAVPFGFILIYGHIYGTLKANGSENGDYSPMKSMKIII